MVLYEYIYQGTDFSECLLLIKEPERALTHLNRAVESFPKGEKLPIDISVKVGVCLILLNRVEAAQKPLQQVHPKP